LAHWSERRCPEILFATKQSRPARIAKEIDMQLGFTPQQQQDYVERHQPSVEEKVDEPVLAWSLFYRTGGWGALAATHVSPLAASAIKLVGKKRAGGLPQHFLLVVTPSKIRAFAFKQKRSDLRIRDELAVWDRESIRVSCRETAMTMRLTIEAPADGENVVCDTGKAAITDRFLDALGAHAEAA